jgi:hypothetical protein
MDRVFALQPTPVCPEHHDLYATENPGLDFQQRHHFLDGSSKIHSIDSASRSFQASPTGALLVGRRKGRRSVAISSHLGKGVDPIGSPLAQGSAPQFNIVAVYLAGQALDDRQPHSP